MKKGLIALVTLSIFLIMIFAPAASLASTISNVSNLTVKPDSYIAGEYTRYQVSFVSNQILVGGSDTISIRFSSDYRFDGLSWSEGFVEVRGQISGGVGFSGGTLTVVMPRNMTVYPGETVNVVLSSVIMRNPAQEGEYKIYVNTSRELSPTVSDPIPITTYPVYDGITRPFVTTKAISGYRSEEIKVLFSTNRNGILLGGVDYINLDFPDGFVLPADINGRAITINGFQMQDSRPVVNGRRMTIILPNAVTFPEFTKIEITIAPEAGIIIDKDVQSARLSVNTSRNTPFIESFPFKMTRTPNQPYASSDASRLATVVEPNGASAISRWTITIPRNTIAMTQGDIVTSFTLTFPAGTIMPSTMYAQNITINGESSIGAMSIPSKKELMFSLSSGVSVYNDIIIVISAAAGIVNPSAGVYIMKFYPHSGTKTIETGAFEIKAVADPPGSQQPQQPQQPYPPQGDRVVKVTLNNPVALKDNMAVTLDSPPQLIDSITMIPLRFVIEGLGAAVDYESSQNTVTIVLGNRTIVLWPGSTLAKVDNVVVTLAKAPFINSNARTMVPLRFVSECFGAKVDYVSNTEPIVITMTADALRKMPSVAEIQAAQTAALAGVSGSGTVSGTVTSPGTGTVSGSDSGLIGKTIALKAGVTDARLRKGPGTNYDIYGLLLPTETAKIIDTSAASDGVWYHVELDFGPNETGPKVWIRSDLVDVK